GVGLRYEFGLTDPTSRRKRANAFSAVPVTGSNPVRAASGSSASDLRAGSNAVAIGSAGGAGILNGLESTSYTFGATATDSANGRGVSRIACPVFATASLKWIGRGSGAGAACSFSRGAEPRPIHFNEAVEH